MFVFLLAGTFAMSASMSASKLMKLPEEEKPGWVQGKNGTIRSLIGGNFCALVLVGAMAYGFMHLDWWIPVVCLIVTFPVIHVVILERLLGPSKGVIIGALLSAVGVALMWVYW